MAAPSGSSSNFFSLNSLPSFIRTPQQPPSEETTSFFGDTTERARPSLRPDPSHTPPDPEPSAHDVGSQHASAPSSAHDAVPPSADDADKPEIGTKRGPVRKAVHKFFQEFDKLTNKPWARMLVFAFAILGFIVLILGIGKTNDNVNSVRKILAEHWNLTVTLAQFFEILAITDDMNSKDMQCLTLLAECEDLAVSGADQGLMAQLNRMCALVVTRCERMVRNHLERLASITYDAGACFNVEDIQFCYPAQQVTSADTLFGLRFDRVGPSSAMFGTMANSPTQSMLNRQEFGLLMAYSFYQAPGASSVTDGIGYVSLNATSPSFGRATVMLETPERGWVHQFYADHERILALGLNSNAIYSWDVSASLSLAVPATTITGAAMASGTYLDNSTLSRPWSIRRFPDGDYLVSMLDSNVSGCIAGITPYCGGLMRLSATAMATNPLAAPSRFDTSPQTLQSTGDCAFVVSNERSVMCGSFGSYDHVLSQRCLDPATDIYADPNWGNQISAFTRSDGVRSDEIQLVPFTPAPGFSNLVPDMAPVPTPDWVEDVGGFIPNRIVQLHGNKNMVLTVTTFGGMMAGFVLRAGSWEGAVLAWVLPLNGDPDDSDDTQAYTTPLVTDAIVSPDNCMLYLASPGLGQVLVYSLCGGDLAEGIPIPQFCTAHQLTSGFNNTEIYVHASNPSRPLYGGPANLAISPDGQFLYASSSSVFDDCLFPEAIAAGGFMVRYQVSASRCDALSIDIDPGFFVDGNALPGRAGIPARLGAIGFSAGDAHFFQADRTIGF